VAVDLADRRRGWGWQPGGVGGVGGIGGIGKPGGVGGVGGVGKPGGPGGAGGVGNRAVRVALANRAVRAVSANLVVPAESESLAALAASVSPVDQGVAVDLVPGRRVGRAAAAVPIVSAVVNLQWRRRRSVRRRQRKTTLGQ